ncbi:MAG TPA: LacI family DNA-binding transcriptional regulator [Tissierellaceae bacterium]
MKRITLSDIAKAAGVSVSTVSRALNQPDMVKDSTRQKVLTAINDLGYVSRRSRTVAREYLEYKNKMDRLPNDTVLSRWGMYSWDERYRDETARIAKLIEKDMNINTKQAYYMLYYMVSNNITDYERAKEDMYVDENFEIYRRKGN